VDLVYEDEDLIAVNKAPGITVIPARNEAPENALRFRLMSLRGEKLWTVHRIDRDTSGLVLFARNPRAHRELSIAFETRRVAKQYLTWTLGAPIPAQGTIRADLHGARRGKMRPARPGEAHALASRTTYRVEAAWQTALGPVARVRVCPETGRHHQIRVHLRFLDTPILVDPSYGGRSSLAVGELGPESPPLPRLALHAASVQLPPLRDRRPLHLAAPLPADLEALDRWLQDRCARAQQERS